MKIKRIICLALALVLLPSCGRKTDDAPASPAQRLAAVFRDQMRENPQRSTEETARTLLAALPFTGECMPAEEGWLNGFDKEITGFTEGTMFSPMIGSIPFVGYVFRLKEAGEADGFVRTLRENGNLRWNVCTQADEMVTETVGDTVLFIMSPLSFDD